MNRILNAEIEIENNRKRIEILTEDRKELEKIQQIVHVPYQFIDMPFDKINIQHEAFSRDAFAKGSIIAAKWIKNKRGIFKMDDILGF